MSDFAICAGPGVNDARHESDRYEAAPYCGTCGEDWPNCTCHESKVQPFMRRYFNSLPSEPSRIESRQL